MLPLLGRRVDLHEEPKSTTGLLEACSEAAKAQGLAKPGDKIGITAGVPPGTAGATNLFKVHTHVRRLRPLREALRRPRLRGRGRSSAVLRDILPERDPRAHVERKVWEFAMLALFLEEAGRLGDATRRSRSAPATSGSSSGWPTASAGWWPPTSTARAASPSARRTASMLADPAAHAPFPYREDRLEVLWTDAPRAAVPGRELRRRRSRCRRSSTSAGPATSPRRPRDGPRAEAGRPRPRRDRVLRAPPSAETAPVDFAVRALTLNASARARPRRRRSRASPRASCAPDRAAVGPRARCSRSTCRCRRRAGRTDRDTRRRLDPRRASTTPTCSEVGPVGLHVGMSAIAKSPHRGLIVLGLLLVTLGVGALALPSLDDMGDVGIIEFELARTSDKASEYYGQLGDAGRDAARSSTSTTRTSSSTGCSTRRPVSPWPLGPRRGGCRGWRAGAARWPSVAWPRRMRRRREPALLRVLDGHTDQPWPGIAFTFATAKFPLSRPRCSTPRRLRHHAAAAGFTFSNIDRARSSCSRSCVAITLVRRRAPPGGTAGWIATFTYTPAS